MIKKQIIAGIIVIVFAQFASADELIRNGDFSSTNPSYIPEWVTGTAYATGYEPKVWTNLYEPPWPNGNSGNVCVMPGNTLGGIGMPPILISFLRQNIYIPRDAIGTTITVNYQWFSTSPFTGMQQYITGRFGSQQILYLQAPMLGGPTPTPGWSVTQPSLSLEGYGGTSVQLSFEVYDDGTGTIDANWIHLDKISLLVITATKTATPTITPTPTVTPTRTITKTFTITPTITPTYTITPTISPTSTITPYAVPGGKAMVFPNPAAGDSVTFMYSLGEPADVSVDVYNVLGLKVAHLEDRNQAGLINRRTTWDISGVAPGVYLYQVTIKTLSGQMTRLKMQRLVITK